MASQSLARKLLIELPASKWSDADFAKARKELERIGKIDVDLALNATRHLFQKASTEFKEHWGCEFKPKKLYPRLLPLSGFHNPEAAVLLAGRCRGLALTFKMLYRTKKKR